MPWLVNLLENVGNSRSVKRSSVPFILEDYIVFLSTQSTIFFPDGNFISIKKVNYLGLVDHSNLINWYFPHSYPDATPEDLASSDNVCIICREEMVTGCKKLPCNHIFHTSCLRSWFQRQQTCPTCRMDVLRAPVVVVRGQQNQQQQQQQQQGRNNKKNAGVLCTAHVYQIRYSRHWNQDIYDGFLKFLNCDPFM